MYISTKIKCNDLVILNYNEKYLFNADIREGLTVLGNCDSQGDLLL